MKTLLIAALVALAVLLPDAGRAHSGHGGIAVLVHSVAADPNAEGERMLLGLDILNGTPIAITLRGLSLEGGGPVAIERRRSFLGFSSWQPVRFIRVDTGDWTRLSPPQYRISVPSNAWQPGSEALTADFGPLGPVTVQEGIQDGPSPSDDVVGQ